MENSIGSHLFSQTTYGFIPLVKEQLVKEWMVCENKWLLLMDNGTLPLHNLHLLLKF